MKSFIKGGIGKVITDYGTKVMDIAKKGNLGRSLFSFIGSLRADSIQFPELPAPGTPATDKGGVIYVKDDGKPYFKSSTTSETDLTQGGGTATHIHEEVKNVEGSTIPAGTPVYAINEVGNSGKVRIGKADASNAAKMPAIGILDTQLVNNAEGTATLIGIFNTNLSGFTGLDEGDIVYVASGGGLTATKPTGSGNLIQNMGIILKTNGTAIQGLQVSCIGRTNDVPNLDNGYIFYGDSNNQAVATQLSTLLPAQSLASVTSSRMRVKGSALDDTSASAPTTPNASGSVHTILEGTGWIHTEDIGERNDINSLPLNIYTGHGQGTDFDSSGETTLSNSNDVSSGVLTLQSGDLKNTGSGDTTTGQVAIVSGDTIDNGSGSHTSGGILIRAGAATGAGDCTAGDVIIKQGYASSSSGTTTHGTLKLGDALISTPVEVLNELKVKSNVIQDDDGVDCITFDSSGNTTIANTLNASLTGNVTGNASTATALTAGNKTIDGNLTIGANQAGHDFSLHGATTNFSKCMWDASHNQLHFSDQAKIVFGTGGGPGGSDSSIQANGSDLVISNTVGDILIGDSVEITGNLDITGIVRPGISAIKILPSDFIADDVGRPAQIDDVASNKRFLKSHSTAKLYASIDIPLGFKATAVDVFGNGTSSMSVHVMSITSGSIAATVGNGSIGTTFNFSGTPVNGSSTDYLLIELAQTSSEQVYGGAVTIAKI